MTRPKTISDADVLAAAREVFRHRGHAASTREVARAAGISEGVLYQRFGSKDALFFHAMTPPEPDVDEVLGPASPPPDGLAFLRGVVTRMTAHFSKVVPLGLQVMMHPHFTMETVHASAGGTQSRLEEGLVARLKTLAARGAIGEVPPAVAARLLVSLAHDWALQGVLSPERAPSYRRDVAPLIETLWQGLRPADGREVRDPQPGPAPAGARRAGPPAGSAGSRR